MHKKGIYSTAIKKEWIHTKPIYSGKELTIKSYPVMERWEDGYMKSLASVVTSNGGKILEVGFGMGISAGYIQKSKKIKNHTIIECHPDVVKHAKKIFPRVIKNKRLIILEGFWENVVRNIPSKSFDGILFDSCPLDTPVEYFQFFPFFKEAYRLLKDNGVFTYFSDEVKNISPRHANLLKKVRFRNIQYRICGVKPPKTCKYWKHKTIVVPIIKKF